MLAHHRLMVSKMHAKNNYLILKRRGLEQMGFCTNFVLCIVHCTLIVHLDRYNKSTVLLFNTYFSASGLPDQK